FDRSNHYAIPAVVGGNARVKSFKCQLSTHRFCLFGAFKRTALNHPAAFIFFLSRLLRCLGLFGDRRSLLRFWLLRSGMRRRLQQILIRLCRLLLRLRLRLLLDRLSLYATRLLLRLCTRLLYRLRLRPLLLLRLLLSLTLALQRLLTLRRGLFVPRYFVQLRRLLAHVRLHLSEQLTLFVRQLIGILYFTPGRR